VSPSQAAKQQCRIFLEHLANWSANHDSSAYFDGKISLLAPSENVDQPLGLGQSTTCILTNARCAEARKQIVIRLYPPGARDHRYKLVIRYGAGWMNAREYFDKEHFRTPRPPKDRAGWGLRQCDSFLMSEGTDGDGVMIQPLFRPFLRLPLELQQMVLGTAAGVTGQWYYGRRSQKTQQPPISFTTMFSISKALNNHLVPWVYRTIDCHFGTTGFTNFLWLIGPLQRAELRHITFSFAINEGKNVLVHFLRWLAPQPIIDLFDPPVPTTPPALCLFWRCQIKDLVKELRLAVLTVDISEISGDDLPMIVRILKNAFGGVECFRFKNNGKAMDSSDAKLNTLREERTWRQECREFFEKEMSNPKQVLGRARTGWLSMSVARTKVSVEDLEVGMNQDSEFFDQVDCAWA
jgi:hypothetical protein